jgi:23S rRNA (adenine2503-C2)-methyltransferase
MKKARPGGPSLRHVVQLLARLSAKVNVIALKPGPGIPFDTPDPGRVASFQAINRRSLPCLIRKPRRLDVYAAYGRLNRMETVELTDIRLTASALVERVSYN